jgi:hypothetical protein
MSVLASAPDIAARRSELRAAEARWRAAGFAPAAVLSLEAEDAKNGRIDTGSPRLSVSRDLLSSAMRRALSATVEADVRVAHVALAAAERQVNAQASRALYGAAAWRAIARRLAAQDSLLSTAESAVRVRFGIGEARYVDVLRLRAERLRVSGREWDITLGQNGMRVVCDGRALMTADGMVCLRHTVVSPRGWCADATVRRQTRVTCGNGSRATLPPGTTRLECRL